ncbi:carbon starvation protein [Anaerosolibacter carboniphilus]|uniref:Carbon starvation protein n=1 Tax=Anaerosolibacter carboniphilus TaxID=1417629 RepID=A0A841KQU9_9FIRM|nr:carbon starvation protein A [Anaerosolibacter carboniphilus]MBB6214470.1 carbon starvation protein [Anaerosolibacter carboniphilus]
MNGVVMMVMAIIILGGAYLTYGRWLAKTWGIDPNAKTPAYEMQDGVDYVPAKSGVVFGHQFASIAGAGPINGPIIAAMFGWVPVLLWILIGGIFFGAVQDFAAMYASVKNKGRSVGYIIELYIGKTGKRLFLLFVWLFSILVVAAFADIVAGTFNGFTAEGALNVANGSTATTSLLFIVAAVTFGLFTYYKKPSSLVANIVGIGLLVASIVLGLAFPIYVVKTAWLYFVFAYVFVASVTPVWALLQPRDYLNSFLLVAMMACAVVGVIVANPTIHLPAFSGFNVNGQMMFPVLFVTIACGAVSGFHALVASGTSSKQIQNEKDMLPISFGAMLLECVLAVIALITVGALAVGGKLPQGTPPTIFAQAISGFLSVLGLPETATFTIITLAVSAFALTSLDSVARVGRLSFQELFLDDEIDEKNKSIVYTVFTNKYFATAITLFLGYLLAVVGYQNIWPLFGSANQLLSALALIALAVFLKKTNRKGFMLWAPMVIMLAVTFTALGQTIFKIYNKLFVSNDFVIQSDGLQLVFAVLLVGLGFMVAISGFKKIVEKKKMVEA